MTAAGIMESHETMSPWNISSSNRSSEEDNGVRKYVEKIALVHGLSKPVIALAGGDPTGLKSAQPPAVVKNKLCEITQSSKYDSYCPSGGLSYARKAVARYCSTATTNITPEDVFICSGAAGALDLVFSAICSPGDNVLLPDPGFPLFRSIASALGIECRYYTLEPSKNFAVNLETICSARDNHTKAIVINNPHNPCGHILPFEEMKAVAEVARSLHLPIIADEVYEEIIIRKDAKFTSFLYFSSIVPVFKICSISKLYVVPGWRIGWCIIGDSSQLLVKSGVRDMMKRLCMRLIFPCSLTQAILPVMLEHAERQRELVTGLIRTNAILFKDTMEQASVGGLKVQVPDAGLSCYDGLENDVEFVDELLRQEAVGLVPGSAFGIENHVRIALTATKEEIEEAAKRIIMFITSRLNVQ
eukprot:jgi/Galph1/947/GphlegSOOS_G5650.1